MSLLTPIIPSHRDPLGSDLRVVLCAPYLRLRAARLHSHRRTDAYFKVRRRLRRLHPTMTVLKLAPTTSPTVLKRARVELNITQREVAALFKPPIDPSLIQLWESGRRAIPPHRLDQLAAILGIPRDLPITTSLVREYRNPNDRRNAPAGAPAGVPSRIALIAAVAPNLADSYGAADTFVQVGYCLEPCHCPRYHCLTCDAYTTEPRHKCA